MSPAEILARARAMRAFADTVRARGGRAVVEEDEDIPVLRALYVMAVAAEAAVATRRGTR